MSARDEIYAAPLGKGAGAGQVADFAFDGAVAEVFADMIARSVPGYGALMGLVGVLAERYVVADSTVYDLGCSLGAGMVAVEARTKRKEQGKEQEKEKEQGQGRGVRFVGVDQSAAMLEKCRENLRRVSGARVFLGRGTGTGAEAEADEDARFVLVEGDVREVEIRNASMVLVNFTLQFLQPSARLGVLRRAYAGLKRGGALVLSEKVCFAGREEEDLQNALHAGFKAANGYSALEIAQKRSALERVMRLDDAATHVGRLREAGFGQVSQWFQAFNFCSFLAVK